MRQLSPILFLATGLALLVLAQSDPLTVDVGPKVSVSDGAAFDGFSTVMALSRDVLAVGIPGADRPGIGSDFGAVYLFHRHHHGPDAWQFFLKLTASDGERSDRFGSSLTFMDNVLAIGARGRDLNRGAVYLFAKQEIGNTGTWVEADTITASDAEVGDLFGTAVSAFGDRLAVGAPGADAPGMSDQGVAYIFNRSAVPGALTETAILTPGSDGGISDAFGTTVAAAGNLVAVGAPKTDIGGTNEQGAVHVFHHNPAGGWATRTHIIDPAGSERDAFGSSLALSSRILAIGHPKARVDTDNIRGKVHLYLRDGRTSTFFSLPPLIAQDGNAGDEFGISVALEGDTLAVGARFADIVGGIDRGAVYLFRPDMVGDWKQLIKLTSNDGVPRDNFGSNVVLSGAAMAVGAPAVTIDGNNSQGAAYLFSIDHYTRWAEENFGIATVADETQRANLWGRGADPDQDCLTNIEEAYFGTNPNAPDRPGAQTVGVAGGKFTFSWHRDPDRPGIEAFLSWSPDLKNWYASGGGPSGDKRDIQILNRGSFLTGNLEAIDASVPTTSGGRIFLRINL